VSSEHSLRKKRGTNDTQLIHDAYDTPSGVYYDDHTLAIAGTRDARDLLSDAMLAAGYTDTLPGSREKAVEKALKVHDVKRLVGHSLGGYVAADHASEVPRVVAYNPGALASFPSGENIRIVRNEGDLVSATLMGDPRTTNVPSSWDPITAHQMPVIPKPGARRHMPMLAPAPIRMDGRSSMLPSALSMGSVW